MSGNIELFKRDAQTALVIRDQVGMFKLPKVMGPAYMKIARYLEENGITPKEAPFTSYHVGNWNDTINMKGFKAVLSALMKKWDVEMGFPLPSDVDLRGNDVINSITLPGGEYIKTLHVGPYQSIGAAYKAIYQLAKQEDLVLRHKSYEFYLNSPREVTKDKLETRILVPVSRKTAEI